MFLSACMTMDTLSESKDLYKKGHYFEGTFTGLLGLTVVPIADIFTLGGALDSGSATQAWTGAGQQMANNGKTASGNRCDIKRNTLEDGIRLCNCEKGNVVKKTNYIGCHHSPPKSSWGCTRQDNGRLQCAISG